MLQEFDDIETMMSFDIYDYHPENDINLKQYSIYRDCGKTVTNVQIGIEPVTKSSIEFRIYKIIIIVTQ